MLYPPPYPYAEVGAGAAPEEGVDDEAGADDGGGAEEEAAGDWDMGAELAPVPGGAGCLE